MTKGHFLYLNIGDIHLGHENVPTKDVVYGVKQYFIDNKKLFMKLNTIFIMGDYYHKMLSAGTEEYRLTIELGIFILKFCEKHNISLRFLDGTESHDNKQFRVFIDISKEFDVDFKYIDTLYIEDNHNGFSILYIPDDLNPYATDTMTDIKRIMFDNGYDKVDLIMMHGAFKYQLPYDNNKEAFDQDEMLEFVRYAIHAGHIHTYSTYKKIIVEGSFDRTKHNEEEDKGAVVTSIYGDTVDHKFIKNKYARPFVTLEITDLSKLQTMVKSTFNKYKRGMHIRLKFKTTEKVHNSLILELSEQYPLVVFTRDIIKERTNDEIIPIEEISVISITQDNIVELVLDEIKPTDRGKYELEMEGLI